MRDCEKDNEKIVDLDELRISELKVCLPCLIEKLDVTAFGKGIIEHNMMCDVCSEEGRIITRLLGWSVEEWKKLEDKNNNSPPPIPPDGKRPSSSDLSAVKRFTESEMTEITNEAYKESEFMTPERRRLIEMRKK